MSLKTFIIIALIVLLGLGYMESVREINSYRENIEKLEDLVQEKDESIHQLSLRVKSAQKLLASKQGLCKK